MDTADLMDTPAERSVDDPGGAGSRRCTADAKSTGKRCKRRPIAGGRVCKIHGGGAPQVERSARQRLAAMVEPALAALADVVEGREWGATPADKLRAAGMILDRTGYPARAEISLVDGIEEIEAILDDLEA